jgi:hypothetical protein
VILVFKINFYCGLPFLSLVTPGDSVIPIPLHPERSQGEEEEESYGCIAII